MAARRSRCDGNSPRRAPVPTPGYRQPLSVEPAWQIQASIAAKFEHTDRALLQTSPRGMDA
ncbi:hypothetical protein B0T18DRAFT_403141 [Schizothecium vesticola]|uniref:Uncharacterized protein n=1 Tax=Schizothecium vesticola TaxID=314040 RepID=A0AA40KAM7_9PEZI|nr:hypothetical protein B0T18DRAFT_403141 [Schizothecium vesticola]